MTRPLPGFVSGTPPRQGGKWRQAAGQSIGGGGGFVTLTWDTEDQDSDGYGAAGGSVLTIPTALDGLYAFTAEIVWPAGAYATTLYMSYNGVRSMRTDGNAGNNVASNMTIIRATAAGTTHGVTVVNGDGVAHIVTATVELWRLSR